MSSFIYFLVFSFSIVNQSFLEINQPKLNLDKKFWFDGDYIKFLIDDNIYQYHIESKKISKKKLTYNNVDFNEIYVEVLNMVPYFFHKSGGYVFELRNDSILRIDNSYNHRLHNASLNFSYNNTHYRFGGYGFFNRNQNLVFYNNKTNEWNLKFNFQDDLKRGISDVRFHSIIDNNLFIYGGSVSYNGGPKIKYDPSIYRINLIDNNLKKTGELNPDFPGIRNYVSNDHYVFLLSSLGEVIFFDKKKELFHINKVDFNPKLLIGVKDKKVFYLTNSTFENNFKIDSFYINDFIENKNVNQFLIHKKKDDTIQIFFFLILIVFILIFTKDFKKKKIIIGKNYILDQNGIKVKLTIEQIDFLNFLKEKRTNVELLSFLGNSHLDIGHQNRLKIIFISSLNNTFSTLFGFTIIISEKDPKDNRSIIYKLNGDFID